MIKNIVLSGGGVVFLTQLGKLKTLSESGVWKIDNIEKIYSTSAGCLVSILITLKIEWDIIIEYIIERPWNDVIKITPENIMNMLSKKGLWGKEVMVIFFKSLFDSINLSLDITMKEYYEYNGKEIHFFTFDINAFELIDLSYITHPDLKLIDAIFMSCSIPLVFNPICSDDKCYIDGGMMMNYPLHYCFEKGCKIDETLALKTCFYSNSETKKEDADDLKIINEDTIMIDYITIFINKILKKLEKKKNLNHELENDYINSNEIECVSPKTTLEIILLFLDDKDFRSKLYNDGMNKNNNICNL